MLWSYKLDLDGVAWYIILPWLEVVYGTLYKGCFAKKTFAVIRQLCLLIRQFFRMATLARIGFDKRKKTCPISVYYVNGDRLIRIMFHPDKCRDAMGYRCTYAFAWLLRAIQNRARFSKHGNCVSTCLYVAYPFTLDHFVVNTNFCHGHWPLLSMCENSHGRWLLLYATQRCN